MAETPPERWMRRAIRLSLRGFPAPNPRVGCAIVQHGEIVGEGWHAYAGGIHAETAALRQAGPKARGAEVFVTLEPCNHEGRQPPCSKALIEAGVRRVVYAIPDPNPKVAGRGAEALRANDIAVNEGLLRAEAAEANRPWLESMRLGRPFVTIKAAMSLDGRIALPTGESKWITGERARQEGHRLRAEMGAVLVGAGTVEKDDPELTARLRGVVNPPVRIVFDPDRVLGEDRKVFRGVGTAIRVVRPERARDEDLANPTVADGFDLRALLAALWDRGITGVLVEGGAQTISGFLRAGLADRLALFVGNVTLGAGPSWVEGSLAGDLASSMRWRLAGVRRLGDDVLMKFDPLA